MCYLICPLLQKSILIIQPDNFFFEPFIRVFIHNEYTPYFPNSYFDTRIYKVPKIKLFQLINLKIELHLTKETKNITLELIDNWLLKNKSENEMNKNLDVLKKYNNVFFKS
jgi:hypothetical protein